jgi:hypothetical protein
MKIITPPWIAVDIGSDRTHIAYSESNGEVRNIIPMAHEFDSVFHVSQNTKDIRTGRKALEQLDHDPDGIVLLQTSLLKADEPICFPDGRGEIRPSLLFSKQLRRIKEYCEIHIFEGQPIQSCVLSLPHRHEVLRNSYRRIAVEAGFPQILFRDAVIAAATAWRQVWEEDSPFIIICNLSASQVSFSLLRYRFDGYERIGHFHSNSTVGIDEIDRIILLSQDSDSQIVSVEKWNDRLRLKTVRRDCHWEKNEDFRVVLDTGPRRIRTEHFIAATNIVAKKIQSAFKRFVVRSSSFVKQENIPVVLIGGGANIPVITEAVEKAAPGKVYWWAEAEEAVVMGTAMKFLPKQKPDESKEMESHFHQLYLKAEAGDQESQYYLGKSLELGHGTAVSPEEALDWYRLSAQNGFQKAKQRLAMLLFKRLGTICNTEESLVFLRELAQEGDAMPQYLLGRYLHENTKDSVTEAENWLRQAARQGIPDAVSYCEKHFGGL